MSEINTSEEVIMNVTDRVITVANVITFIRLILAPTSLAFLLMGEDIVATVIFSITAATDFLDGQIARRTNTVSKIGQLLDPAVDCVLMICGVVGLLAVGRMPAWIVAVILLRDIFLITAGSILYRGWGIRVPVVYAGKFATTFLFVGIAGIILNMPLIPGLGLCDFGWLPGFNNSMCSWGIWLVYLGLCIGLFVTVYYIRQAWYQLQDSKQN